MELALEKQQIEFEEREEELRQFRSLQNKIKNQKVEEIQDKLEEVKGERQILESVLLQESRITHIDKLSVQANPRRTVSTFERNEHLQKSVPQNKCLDAPLGVGNSKLTKSSLGLAYSSGSKKGISQIPNESMRPYQHNSKRSKREDEDLRISQENLLNGLDRIQQILTDKTIT